MPTRHTIFRSGTEQNPKVGRSVIFLDSIRRLSPRRPVPALKPTVYYVPVVSTAPLCPECAGPLTRASGCINCVYCGWGRCG
jgi:hypothetical protein